MSFPRSVRQQHVVHRLLAVVLLAGGVVLFGTAAAFATGPTISAKPALGLFGGVKVTVTGSGLAANAKGYVLECNQAPSEPTVYIGPPFDEAIPIGCSPPSLKHITGTTTSGTLSTIIVVHEGRKLGPPCGPVPVIAGCGGADSAGKKPRADAQNYPCPPSPAQQVAGVKCALVFIDTAHETVSTPIAFQGAGTPPPPTTAPTIPPTTAPTSPPTTAPRTPPTTAPQTTPTTSPGGGSGVAPTSVTKTSPSTASPVTAGSGSLAFTGVGSTGKILALVGAFLMLFGLVLYFFDLRKIAGWFLGL